MKHLKKFEKFVKESKDTVKNSPTTIPKKPTAPSKPSTKPQQPNKPLRPIERPSVDPAPKAKAEDVVDRLYDEVHSMGKLVGDFAKKGRRKK